MYYLVRPIARIAIKIFYRKIYFSNLEHIPRGKPVILAANHPTAFMEPCIAAIFLKQPLYFLVRGDFFGQRFYRFLLESLKMLPIYRIIDAGYSGLKNNYATFEACADALFNGKTIMMFPEGNTTHEKRMRPVRKGLARIVAGTLEKYPDLEEIYVVPLGVNYSYAEQPRSMVMIDAGEPIPVKPFFAQGVQKGITALTAVLKEKLEERVVIIENPGDEDLAEQLLVMSRSGQEGAVLPISSPDKSRLYKEMAIANHLNKLEEKDKEPIAAAANAYFAKLEVHGIKDNAVCSPHQFSPFFQLLILLGKVPALAGRIFCALPMQLALYIKKTRVERIEFFAPVLLAVSMGCFVVYYLLWLLIAGITGLWFLLPVVLALGLLGYWDIVQRELSDKIAGMKRFLRLPAEEQQNLQAMRAAVVNLSGCL